MSTTLVYVHDPMCSWCFGFKNTQNSIMKSVAGRIPVRRLLGGLAPDTDNPMPPDMQNKLQQTWRNIENVIPGTRFNYNFWTQCKPRRATYPACRAVIAARNQGEHFDAAMTDAIQQAYYLKARNPSDHNTLVSLADEIGLDVNRFDAGLRSDAVHQRLIDEVAAARAIGISSYPSLALVSEATVLHIDLAYTNPESMLKQIDAAAKKMLC